VVVKLPLHGVRVVDFSRLLPGPWCTQVLGDLGADVIKIEQAGIGDYGRHNPPKYKETGVYFASVNRNKRSIELDLTVQEDHDIALSLIRDADILVESYRPGVTQRLGIGYDEIKKLNPSIIYCSITGFGADGELAGIPGHDLSIQGMAGLVNSGEEHSTAPATPLFHTGDYSAAIYAAIGILAAYIRRTQTGEGCFLDVPMFDCTVAMASVTLSSALARLAGASGEPKLEVFGTNPRFACYRTRDGKAVSVSLLEARTWRHFCEHIARPDLVYDEKWSDRHTVHQGRTGEFKRAISEFCLSDDRDPLVKRMLDAGIPICAIYNDDEVVTSPEANARDLVAFLEHPVDGAIPYFRDPLMRAGLSDPTRRHVPSLGEHSDELRELAKAASSGKAAGNIR
jgi:crotonobetainyl-CoA:carnitine CoA-transferase CaiB-like acyl-CoA transferase